MASVCRPRPFRLILSAAATALALNVAPLRRAAAAAIAGCVACWGAWAQIPPGAIGFTAPDIQALRGVADVQISPDGSRVAYVVSSNERSGRPSTALWVYTRAAGSHIPAGDQGDPVSMPRWSPDGRWIAYLGRPGGRPGIALVRVDDELVSDPELLVPVTTTNHPIPHTGEPFVWSPGSSRIAYASAMPGPEVDEGNGDPVVVTRYAFKPATGEGPGRLSDNRRLQLFMVDLVSKQPQALTDAPSHHHSLDWSRKGDEILLASNQGADPDRVFNDDLFAFNVARRALRRVTDTPGVEYDPVWSPDGTAVAFRASVRPRTSSETTVEDTHVWVMKPDGTQRRPVAPAIDNRHGAPKWSADGRWLYFTVQERGDVRLYRAPAAPGGGAAEAVVPAPSERGVVGSWSLARDGTVAFAMTTPDRPAEVYIKTPAADRPERVTTLNDELLAARRVAPTERFTFAAEGGLEVEAFLTLPLSIDATKRHPMIVAIHGGPHGQQGPSFAMTPQVYAAKGWATLMVNYRGSTGYGQRFADAIIGDQNGAEARDVLAGVDAALARFPWIDPARLGVQGGSYGGQLTNWIVTQTDRFKAAVSTAGISNLISFNYTSYYHDYLAAEFGAYPHEGDLMDRLFQRSPIRHVARVRTPVMFIHGELDNNVPVGEAEQFYIALKDVGVDTVMVRYPREGHGLREGRHQADALARAIAWYERHFAR